MSRLFNILLAAAVITACAVAIDSEKFKESWKRRMAAKEKARPVMARPVGQMKRDDGTCGTLTWTFDEDTGVFTLSGEGDMDDECDFWDSDVVTEVVIDDGVTSILPGTFEWWPYLTKVSIGKSLVTVAPGAFVDSPIETITVSSENANLIVKDDVLMSKDEKSIILCSTTKEGNYVIPDTVVTIEPYAFYGCYDLSGVTFGKNVETIGASAFDTCMGFETIVIGEKVKTIGDMAFNWCFSVTSLTIPASVEEIGEAAFGDMDSLEFISVDKNNKNFSSHHNVLYNKEQTVLILCPEAKWGQYVMPNTVEVILKDAFYYSSLDNITLSKSLKSIGNGAFSMCRSLQQIIFPEGLVVIGAEAFSYCTQLTEINLPNSLEELGEAVFDNCIKLESFTVGENNKNYTAVDGVLFNKDVTEMVDFPTARSGAFKIPESVLVIDDEAFDGASKLTSVTMGNAVTEIGARAFRDCEQLASVTLSTAVTEIQEETFSGCFSLTTINIDKITNFGEKAFYGCGLTSVTLADGVDTIMGGAFASCNKLTGFQVGANNNDFTSDDGILYNKNKTILVQYPGGKSGAYTAPDDVVEVSAYAFSGSVVSSVTLKDTVTKLGSYAFEMCGNLETLVLSKNIERIMAQAFAYCTKLTTITIPESATSVLSSAFTGCSALTEIKADNNQHYVAENGVLYNKAKTEIVCYPLAKGGEYVIPDTVTSVGYNTFGNSMVEKITIGKGITSLGYFAFDSCPNLTTVIFSEKIMDISVYAFDECGKLAEFIMDENNPWFKTQDGVLYNKNMTTLVLYPLAKPGAFTIPDSVNDLLYSPFSGRTKITSCTLGHGIRTLPQASFFWCPELTEVILNEELEEYEQMAIGACDKLTKIEISANSSRFVSVDGILFSKDKKTIVAYPSGKEGEYKLPAEVTTIGGGAFAGAHFEQMKVGSTVTKIEGYAFYRSHLKNLYIDESVTYIGSMAMCWCENLQYVTYTGKTNPGVRNSDLFCEEIPGKICLPSDYNSSSFCGYRGVFSNLDECPDPEPPTPSPSPTPTPTPTAPSSSSVVVMPCVMLMALLAMALACLF